MPQEGQTGTSTGFEDVGYYWEIGPDEQLTDTVEAREDEEYLFIISEGSADVEATVR